MSQSARQNSLAVIPLKKERAEGNEGLHRRDSSLSLKRLHLLIGDDIPRINETPRNRGQKPTEAVKNERERELIELKVRNKILKKLYKDVTQYKIQRDLYRYMKSIQVLPESHLLDKWNYFYSGYNFEANLKRHMSFD